MSDRSILSVLLCFSSLCVLRAQYCQCLSLDCLFLIVPSVFSIVYSRKVHSDYFCLIISPLLFFLLVRNISVNIVLKWMMIDRSNVDRLQGRIQDFKLGGALKKIAPSRGRRENIWGIV